ncbi:MAG: hypothetical protein ACLFSB_02710 [Chitinispirillaceae bacterium]
MAERHKSGVETRERGDIYFFYRPKIEQEEPHERSDVQRMYFVMSPEDRHRYRLAIVGGKRMPDPSQSATTRLWGFIDMVRKDPKSIRQELMEQTYSTKTRGRRRVPAARPFGEGVYRIVKHDGHTHLVYALELPKQEREPQHALNVEDQASYVISVKNPQRPSPRGAGLGPKQEAQYPKYLMEKFRGRKFSEVDPVEFLDHEGAEMMLVSASEDIQDELGITLDVENETKASADIFRDLHVDSNNRPTEPLFTGVWE